jgi:hypothetical protein
MSLPAAAVASALPPPSGRLVVPATPSAAGAEPALPSAPSTDLVPRREGDLGSAVSKAPRADSALERSGGADKRSRGSPSGSRLTLPAALTAPIAAPKKGSKTASLPQLSECDELKLQYEACMVHAAEVPLSLGIAPVPCFDLYQSLMERCGSSVGFTSDV